MKTLIRFLALAVFAVTLPTIQIGCSTPPNERVVAVQSLKAVGQTAEAAMDEVVQLFKAGKITAAQDRAISDFYDQKFQPAFRIAKNAVNGDLSSLASPDISGLLGQLLTLVANLKK